ncbi:type IV pilus secretin PilQ, partial [Candidatus Magnetoovum chiemensis]
MLRKVYLLYILLLLYVFLMSSCASVNVSENNSESSIKEVKIEDYKIEIVADGQFEYSTMGSDDPYKILVGLENVAKSEAVIDRIISDKAGIREVRFSTKMLPKPGFLAEIILSEPLKVDHKYENNKLYLTFKPNEKKDDKISPDLNGKDLMVSKKNYSSGKAENITDIAFKAENNSVQIKILADGEIIPETTKFDNELDIKIPDVKLSAKVPENLSSPLRSLRYQERKDGVKFILELDKNTGHVVSYVNEMVIITLTADAGLAESDINLGITRNIPEPNPVGNKDDMTDGHQKADDPSVTKEDNISIDKAKTFEQSVDKIVEKTINEKDNAATIKPPLTNEMTGETTAPSQQTPGQQDEGEDLSGENLLTDGQLLNGSFAGCSDDGFLGSGSCDESMGFHPLNLDFQAADIIPIFRLLSDVSGCNIVVNADDPKVKGKRITMKVKDSTWTQVGNIILKTHGLACKNEGNIIMIIPRAILQAELKDKLEKHQQEAEIEKLKRQAREEALKSEVPVLKIFKISYAKAKDIKAILEGKTGTAVKKTTKVKAGAVDYEAEALSELTRARVAADAGSAEKTETLNLEELLGGLRFLSKNGIVTVDERLEALIVQDSPSYMPRIEGIIKKLDIATPQVLIEARIVEISRDYSG